MRAQKLAREALAQHRPLGNRFDIAWDLHATGISALRLGELDEAIAEWREALQMFVDAADESGIVLTLSNYGEHARTLGDLEREATLVGAWTALGERTGVGLASLWGASEGRTLAKDITAEHQAAFERGRAMKTDEAVAFALAAPTVGR